MARKSKRLAPTPVLPDYYDDSLAQLLWAQKYPRGETERKQINGEWVDVDIAPEYQTSEDRRDAARGASRAEDAALGGLLGSKRKRRKGEQPGAYALADYPQLGIALMQASQGQMAPGGNAANIGLWMKDRELGADPLAAMKRDQERKMWAARQAQIVGRWR